MIIDIFNLAVILLIMVASHEFIHLLSAFILGVRVKGFGFSLFGPIFILRDECLIDNDLKLILVHTSPLILSLTSLFNNFYCTLFSSLNMAGSIGDIYLLIKFLRIRDTNMRCLYSKQIEEKIKRVSVIKYMS